MDIAHISTLSVLAGSVIGGLTSTGTTWLTQRAHARSGLLANEIVRREDLYRDFISAASKTYGDALVSSEPQVPELVALYSMISRMRVLAAPRTVASADKVMLTIMAASFAPNQSVRELRDPIKCGRHVQAFQLTASHGCLQLKERHMAQSKPDESQRRLATELERPVDGERAEIAAGNESLFDSSAASPESLDLGHARLRNECWAASRCGAQRYARAVRKRTPLHLARPPAPADAHFTSPQPQYID